MLNQAAALRHPEEKAGNTETLKEGCEEPKLQRHFSTGARGHGQHLSDGPRGGPTNQEQLKSSAHPTLHGVATEGKLLNLEKKRQRTL